MDNSEKELEKKVEQTTEINQDKKDIEDLIKEVNNIDYIRVQFNNANENMNIVRNYFRNNSTVVLQELDKKTRQLEQIDKDILEQNSLYSYISLNTFLIIYFSS